MPTLPPPPFDGCGPDGGRILRDLIRFLICQEHEPQKIFARLTVQFDDGTDVTFTNALGAIYMITIPSTQLKTFFSIAYVDVNGAPAKVDGAPVWTGPDPSFGTFETSADGFHAKLTLPTPPVQGTFQLRVDADADLGDGVKSLVTLGDCEIIGGEAVAGVISASDTGPEVNPLKKK